MATVATRNPMPHSAVPNGTPARGRVLLVISGLERGGAERQVVALANALPHEGFETHICSLSDDVPLAEGLDEPSALHIVTKRWRFDVGVVRRVQALITRLRPDVVHGFLFDADIVARLAAYRAGVPVVLASERNTDYRRPWHHKLCQRATRHCYDALVANSHAGREFAQRTLRLPDDRVAVVPNGVNVKRFAPENNLAARETCGLPTQAPVVGMVAAIKPQKNYEMFVEVAGRLADAIPDVHFLCVGAKLRTGRGDGRAWHAGAGLHGNTTAYAEQIRALLAARRLTDRMHWLPHAQDMPAVYNACDVLVLTSNREGMPNCVLEAMACGRPTVVTNVADNARIVAHERTGFVVPPGDAAQMTAHLKRLLSSPALRTRLGHAARERCLAHYSETAAARAAATLYCERLRRPRASTTRDAPRAAGKITTD